MALGDAPVDSVGGGVGVCVPLALTVTLGVADAVQELVGVELEVGVGLVVGVAGGVGAAVGVVDGEAPGATEGGGVPLGEGGGLAEEKGAPVAAGAGRAVLVPHTEPPMPLVAAEGAAAPVPLGVQDEVGVLDAVPV